jgi:SAM-dependent methyltransferase
MVEPIAFPESLLCDWYGHAPRIHAGKKFTDICAGHVPVDQESTLQAWAQGEMLAFGDPIENLVSYIHALVIKQRHMPRNLSNGNTAPVKTKKSYFNKLTHENDVFDDAYVKTLTEKWTDALSSHRKPVGQITPTTAAKEKNIINKTMSYSDLLTPEAAPTVKALNSLILDLYRKGIWMSSWVGTLPEKAIETSSFFCRLKRYLGLNKTWWAAALENPKEGPALKRGIEQRLDYKPLPNAADDVRFPWFLYWEIFWVMKVTGSYLKSNARILDGGGSASLFTTYMASLGYEIHSVELNDKLNRHCRKIARAMNWNLKSYTMDLRQMEFPDEYFDHAYSICVFEHLDYDIKQSALAEIARCLKPGGIFSITFDYRNPAPGVVGYGKDTRPRNQLKTEEDIKRNFLSTGHFELMGNADFLDTGDSNLIHQRFGNTPYTFGAIFMKKK